MAWIRLALILAFCGLVFCGRRSSNEIQLKKRLFRGYDTSSRPVQNDTTTVTVHISISLYHILETNERSQTLSALLAVRLKWIDEYMQWNPNEYDGLRKLWLPMKSIWVPDLVITNYASEDYLPFMNTNAIIQSSGKVLWMFPLVVKVYCSLDVRYFPFDEQECDVVFISWTYNGFEVNMTDDKNSDNAVYYKPQGQQWAVDRIGVQRSEKKFACCVEPYPDVKFTIYMTRRSLFYIINLICPCVLIYLISFLGFFLPVESGEKVNLEITVLLALVVFLLMVGEIMPPTPDAIPVVGMLVGVTMVMVSIALIMAVIITNVYFKKETKQKIPSLLRRIFLSGNIFRRIRDSRQQRREPKRHRDGEFEQADVSTEGETFIYHEGRNGNLKPSAEPHRDHPPEDWQKLACQIDRLFFWCFLVFSMCSIGAIFFQIPPVMNGTVR